MVSDKTIHKTVRTHKTLQTKPIREFFLSLFTKTIIIIIIIITYTALFPCKWGPKHLQSIQKQL